MTQVDIYAAFLILAWSALVTVLFVRDNGPALEAEKAEGLK
jgi:hypothetical protein